MPTKIAIDSTTRTSRALSELISEEITIGIKIVAEANRANMMRAKVPIRFSEKMYIFESLECGVRKFL